MALATLRTYLRSAANDSMPVQEFPPGNSTVSLEYMASRLSIGPYAETGRQRSRAKRRERGRACGHGGPDSFGINIESAGKMMMIERRARRLRDTLRQALSDGGNDPLRVPVGSRRGFRAH